MSYQREISFKLNGNPVTTCIPLGMTTVTMLRDVLKKSGTKFGCGEGECGACTILVDGKAINSCLNLAADCEDREVTTVEGLMKGKEFSVLQEEFIQKGAAQCGFCTPGMLMQGTYMIEKNSELSENEIKRGIEGNICRCTGYKKIVDAIAAALYRMHKQK